MGYESEHTKYMREMFAKHPEWADDQRRGRDLLWDRPIDLAEQRRLGESSIQSKAYPYDVNFEF